MNKTLRKDIINIIRASVSAPSGDNMQPWRFKVKNNIIQVWFEEQTEGEKMFGLFASYLTQGALIENIFIAADHYGYYPDIDILPDPQNPFHTATIKIHPDPTDRGVDLFRFFYKRFTHRGKFATIPIESYLKTRMSEIVESFGSEYRLAFIENKKGRHAIARSAVAQTKLYFSNKKLHKAFFETLRWNKESFYSNRDGLYIKTLRLNHAINFTLRYILRWWAVVYILDYIGGIKLVTDNEFRKYKDSGSYCALILKKETTDPSDIIESGRILQRTWLIATKHNLQVHPTSAFLLLNKSAESGSFSFNTKETTLLKNSLTQAKQACGVKNNESLQWVIRIGTAFDTKKCRTIRKEPDITFSEN